MLAPLGKAVAEVQPGAALVGRGWVRGRAVPAGEKNYFKKNESSTESPLGSTTSPPHGLLLPASCLSFPSHPAGISAGGQGISARLIRARVWQMAGEEPGQGTVSRGPPRRPPKLLQLWALLGDSRMG